MYWMKMNPAKSEIGKIRVNHTHIKMEGSAESDGTQKLAAARESLLALFTNATTDEEVR